jgi:hypothetical protein
MSRFEPRDKCNVGQARIYTASWTLHTHKTLYTRHRMGIATCMATRRARLAGRKSVRVGRRRGREPNAFHVQAFNRTLAWGLVTVFGRTLTLELLGRRF